MGMRSIAIRVVVVAYVVAALSGCASHGNVVRCSGRLEPINLPVPRAAQTAVGGGSSDSDASRSDHE